MSGNILNLRGVVEYNDDIAAYQHHAYSPYTQTLGHEDQIRIVIQVQDLYVLPHDSHIYNEARTRLHIPADAIAPGRVPPTYVNNAASFLFGEIRYEINRFPIDSCGKCSNNLHHQGVFIFPREDMNRMHIASWDKASNTAATEGYLNFCIPPTNILGFADDHRTVVLKANHELILVRNRLDVNYFTGPNNIANITIEKNRWRMPHVSASVAEMQKIMQFVNRRQPFPCTTVVGNCTNILHYQPQTITHGVLKRAHS